MPGMSVSCRRTRLAAAMALATAIRCAASTENVATNALRTAIAREIKFVQTAASARARSATRTWWTTRAISSSTRSMTPETEAPAPAAPAVRAGPEELRAPRAPEETREARARRVTRAAAVRAPAVAPGQAPQAGCPTARPEPEDPARVALTPATA